MTHRLLPALWLLAALPTAPGCLGLLPLPKSTTTESTSETVPDDTIIVGDDDDDDDDDDGDDDDDTTETTEDTDTDPTTEDTDTDPTPTGPVATSVYDLQDGQVAPGTEVEVLDVVVTATADQGFYVQERAGGARSGIWVQAGAGWSQSWPVDPGDLVDIVGLFDEAGPIEAIDLNASGGPDVRVVGTSAPPAPTAVSIVDLQSGGTAERWEGVLVEVEDVAVTVPDAGAGTFEIGAGPDTVVVDDQVHRWTRLGEVPAGATVVRVVGVVNQSQASSYELVPRSDADITLAAIDLFALNQGQVTLGTEVEAFGLVVTGVAYDGVYAQEEGGGPYSGVWVYLGVDWEAAYGPIDAGDRVHVWGLANEYNGLTELDLVGSADPRVEVGSSGAVPAAEVLAVADVGEAWECVLVEVLDVVVDEPDLGFGEWSVTPRVGGGGATVVIDDKIYAWPGALAVGDRFDRITGPLHYNFGAFKIEPRDAGDIVAH